MPTGFKQQPVSATNQPRGFHPGDKFASINDYCDPIPLSHALELQLFKR